MDLSIVIPAHNEEGSILSTLNSIHRLIQANSINCEIIVINDYSTDSTYELLENLEGFRLYNNEFKNGFGNAIKYGISKCNGKYVTFMMADASDDVEDLLLYFNTISVSSYDCVLGSRFIKGSKVKNYPILKLLINRVMNNIIKLMFSIKYNDISNAFKIYKREALIETGPFYASDFSLTVEIPLRIINRNYTYGVVPISWTGRHSGISKLKIKEMYSRYLNTIIFCYFERRILIDK